MKKLRVAILIDPCGWSGATDDEEYAGHIEHFTERLGRGHTFYRAHNPGDGLEDGIREGTDLIIYDYGGMLGCGDLLASNARAIIRWAQEHPSGLILVASMMTWRQQISLELEELGLTTGDSWDRKSALPNLMEFHPGMHLPEWFLRTKLPSQTFFRPTNKFIAWLSKQAGPGLVVDAGAGVGHLTARLDEAGVRCFGIDLIPRDREEAPVYLDDATTFGYSNVSVAVIARPSHGFWVEKAIRKMKKDSVSKIFYVGLEKNVSGDLGDLFDGARKVGFGAGADEECVWIV